MPTLYDAAITLDAEFRHDGEILDGDDYVSDY